MFSAIVVLYNPGEEELERITNYSKKFRDVSWIVIDNSQTRTNFFSSYEDIIYVHNMNRGGIAGAINIGFEHLSTDSEYFFTFDQDSILPENFFDSMEKVFKIYDAKLVCANFIDINSNTYAKFVHLKKYSYQVVDNTEYTNFAISSGMGIKASFWKDIKGVNNEYIIDHVDTEICLKAYSLNEKIFVNYDVCLKHAIGNRSVHRFLGVTLKPNHHNYIRKYYIVRNGTHLAFLYFWKTPGYFILNIYRVIHEFLCVILYEKDKIKKLRYMIKGLFHSITGKLGNIS